VVEPFRFWMTLGRLSVAKILYGKEKYYKMWEKKKNNI